MKIENFAFTVGTYPVYVRNKAHHKVSVSDIHRVCPYVRPQIRLASLDTDADLMGIIETSGEPGPDVHTDDPVNPDPGTELTNPGSVWEDAKD